ncbi:SHOCT domain-containing protein [Corynebacterium aurimucosum]
MGIFKKNDDRKQNEALIKERQSALLEHLPKLLRRRYIMAARVAGAQLKDGEAYNHLIAGELNGIRTFIIPTDSRILIAGLSGVKSTVRELRYEDVSEVGTEGATLILRDGSHTIELKRCITPTMKEVSEEIRSRAEELRRQAPSASSGVSEIEKLAELHAAGVLTDEEFAAAKAKALGL